VSKTIKQFDYRIFKMKKGDPLPMDPVVILHLEHWTTDKNSDAPLISPHLTTADEIDWHIKALKDNLDSVGRLAKSALTKAREETRAIVTERIQAREGDESIQ
jgi:hypothetical protein